MTYADDIRKADFREVARRIVADDRSRRKYGHKVDTAGTIVRALERAYRRGLREAREGIPAETKPSGHIDWRVIPPKPRQAFGSICSLVLGNGHPARPEYAYALSWRSPGAFGTTPGAWVLVVDCVRHDGSTYQYDDSFGDRTLSGAVKLGLLENDQNQLRITDLGRGTWWAAIETVGGDDFALWNDGTTPPDKWRL